MSNIDPAQLFDLERCPIDRLDSTEGRQFLTEARAALDGDGIVDIEGLVRPDAVTRAVAEVTPVLDGGAFLHERRHNIYFRRDLDLPADHPALNELETRNETVCADQIPGSVVMAVYGWPPLLRFLEALMDKPRLYPMADPLARVNVMRYHPGWALNWHFDRAEFTITLLLQAPGGGGAFEYRTDLRTANDPNYAGVAALLESKDDRVQQRVLTPGTLNVFRGRNTAHRVTPVTETPERIIAVFSYFERPDVLFSAEERRGFYGRAG